ncbi:hypothetical protein B4U84_29270 [Westiellopsis prolifica IICB1]|nr:hypothetical protein B4U84_29270 [Westiellopsis prolifica IICB1]
MPKNNHPAAFAITIAGSEDRTHYFDDRSEFDDFVRGLLVGEDEGRKTPTDFKLYRKATDAWWEWEEQNFDPYDYFKDIDDTPYPLAHGQFLAHFGGGDIDPKILWDIAQGCEKVIPFATESKSTQYLLQEKFQNLKDVGAWARDDEDPAFSEYEVDTALVLYALATQGTSFVDDDEAEAWLYEI